VSALTFPATARVAAGRGRWRPILVVSTGATGVGLLVALAGTAAAAPAATWPRFWATVFFVLLLWPVGLSLVGRLAGLGAEAVVAALLVLATVAQQSGRAEIPLPASVTWWATLEQPDDAIRHRIPLPAPGSASWEEAWRTASRAAVFVCTDTTTPPDDGVTLAVGKQAPAPLSPEERLTLPRATMWYARTVTEPEVRAAGAAGGLADLPFPLVEGRPILGRYFVELRFLDGQGRPTIDIWY
jgi:hypothetical protein